MSRTSLSAFRNPPAWLLLPLFIALLLVFSSVAFFKAQRALTHAREVAQQSDEIAFTLQPLELQRYPVAHFELVASRPAYTSGISFAGELYLGGPSGLTILSPTGAIEHTLRTGIELPVAPITFIAAGRLRGASEPQVLIATSGNGLLVLEPDARTPKLRQLLPAASGARDLTTLLPLATGDLVLGTRDHGVLLYTGAVLRPFRFTVPGIDPANLQVTALSAVDATSFLIGTRSSGVFYAHAGTIAHCDEAGGLPDDQVTALAVAGSHAYVATPIGIADFDLNFPTFRPARMLAQGVFGHALQADETTLTIGTMDQGIQQIPLRAGAHLRRISIRAESPQRTVSTQQRVDSFVSVPGGLLSLADGVLFRRSGASWTPVLPPVSSSLTDRNISTLALAPDGSLYVGYFDHGLDILNPSGDTIRHLEDDHLFCINRLALDPRRKTMAAATANGLVLFDAEGNPRQTLTRRDGLISDHVTDITFTERGTVLATTAGITFIGTTGTESLNAFQGLVNNHVYALAGGRDRDQLAAGTLGGLSLLEGASIQRSFTANNSGLKHNWITALASMPDGGYLVGTYGAGLQTLGRAGHFAAIELPAGAPHDLVINPNAIFVTRKHLYAGTLGHGLLVYSSASGRWSLLAEGLPSLNVTAFAERGGEMYVGTENGLVRIAEAELP